MAFNAPQLEKTAEGGYVVKNFDSRGRFLGLTDQGLSEKDAIGQIASDLSSLQHPETGGPLFDYEGAIAAGKTPNEIVNRLTGVTPSEDMPFWSLTPYKSGLAHGAFEGLGFGVGQVLGYKGTTALTGAVAPKFVVGHPWATFGLGVLGSLAPSMFGAAEGREIAEEVLPTSGIALEDRAEYEGGRTAGFFLLNIPLLFTSALALKPLPFMAPAVVGKNADEVAGLISSADKIEDGFSFLNLEKLSQAVADKSPILRKAMERAMEIGRNAKGRFLSTKELLALNLSTALKLTGEMILKNPRRFALGEATLATTYYGGAGYFAEKVAPGDPVIKAMAETTAVLYNPMSIFTNTLLPMYRTLAQVARPAARNQAAADHLVNVFVKLQKKAGMPDVTPEAFLKELNESKIFDNAGNLVELGLTPAQLTENPAMQLLESYLSKQSEAFSIVQRDAARGGMKQLLGLIEAMTNTQEISALRIAGGLQENNFRQLFSRMFEGEVAESVDKINRVVARGDVSEEMLLKASEMTRGALEDGLHSFRVIENNLWESIPKNIPAQPVHLGATWTRILGDLEGTGKDADIRRRLDSDTISVDLQKMRTPEATEIINLEKELITLNKLKDGTESRFRDLARYGGPDDVLIDALHNYVAGRKDLPTLDDKYRQAEIDFGVPLTDATMFTGEAVRARTRNGVELPPNLRRRLPALAKAQRKFNESVDNIGLVQAKLLKLREENIPEFGGTTFGEIIALRSKLTGLSRKKGGGEDPPYNLLRYYKDLADAALKDLRLAGGHGANGQLLLDSEQLAALDPEAVEAMKILNTALSFSRAGNDAYSRGIGGNLGIQKITGEAKTPVAETMRTLWRGAPSKVWTNYNQMKEALSIVEAAEKLPVIAARFGEDLGPPRPLKERVQELDSPDYVERDVTLPQLRGREAANRATLNDAYTIVIKRLIDEDVIRKERVLNPAASDELPKIPKYLEAFYVDKAKLEAFSGRFGRILKDIPQLQQVTADLMAAPERSELLLRSIEENGATTQISIGSYWKRVREDEAFAKVLGNTNPTMLIAEFISSGNKGNSKRDMDGLFKLAKDHGAEESVRNAVVQYGMDGSRLKDGWDAGKLRRILYTDPFDGVKGSPPLMTLLENKGMATTQFNQRLNKLITHMERIETAGQRGEALKGLLQQGYGLDFAARFLGAATASELQAAVGIGKGAIQIPGAGARMATQIFQHVPNAYIIDVLIQASSPGKVNEDILLQLLSKGRPGRDKPHMRGIKAVPHALLRWLSRIAGTALYRPGIFIRGAIEPEMEEPVSAVVPPSQPVAEAPPSRPLLPRPDFSMLPQLAAPSSSPEQPQLAAPPSSPEQRSRFAAMFPGDITSGLIRQQDVNRGIGSLA